MDIARGENAAGVRIARIFLNRQEQLRRRFVKLAFEEMGFADQAQRRTRALARAQPQRSLGMLDREIVLTAPEPQNATQNQPREKLGVSVSARSTSHHGADILAENGQNKGGVGQDARVVSRHLERLAPVSASINCAVMRTGSQSPVRARHAPPPETPDRSGMVENSATLITWPGVAVM